LRGSVRTEATSSPPAVAVVGGGGVDRHAAIVSASALAAKIRVARASPVKI